MKRKWIVLCSLIIVAMMLVCALIAPWIIQQRKTLGITLKVTDVTSESATLLCTREIGFIAAMVDTGRYYYLERQTSNGWSRLSELSEDMAWPGDALLVPLGFTQFRLNYGEIYGKLPSGTYRVCKRFYAQNRLGLDTSTLCYAEFTIK